MATSLRDVLPAPTDNLPVAPAVSAAGAVQTVVPAAPVANAGVSRTVALPVGPDGAPDYAAVVRQGENATRVVHASYEGLVEKAREGVVRPLPSVEEADVATQRTRAALEGIVSGKIAAAKPKNFKGAQEKAKPSFVRYTPANTNSAHNSGSRQRIIKMMVAPVDPMEPPRFSQKKAPANPPSPPVPVLHSPNRKLSKREAADWKIPPVVSNWKNNRGFTISLDKRLAADGRGTQDTRINDRFASMAESLYLAERNAREDVETRAQMQRNVSLKAKEMKEKELRDLAARARKERSGFGGRADDAEPASSVTGAQNGHSPSLPHAYRIEEEEGPALRVAGSESRRGGTSGPAYVAAGVAAEKKRRRSRFADTDGPAGGEDEIAEETDADVRQRDEVRRDRRDQRDRELRLREAHGDDSSRPTLKKSKLTRDRDRDVSERVALGQSATGGGSGEVMYDQRLFNQGGGAGTGTGALAGGFGAEDAYNLYDKPLFAGATAAAKFQYRPRASATNDADEDRARTVGRADRGFAGSGRATGASHSAAARDRPVEFERDTDAEDPFSINKFLSDAKRGRK